MNITPAMLTDILRKMDAEATKSERFIKSVPDPELKSIHSHGARQMRLAMSLFVYGVGPAAFKPDCNPFIDFRIPMLEPENYSFIEQPH